MFFICHHKINPHSTAAATWEALIAHIPSEVRGDIDLLQVLNDIADPIIFQRIKPSPQRALLELYLGEGEDSLIDAILHSISGTQVPQAFLCIYHTLSPHTSSQVPTLGSKIEDFLLPPSKVKESEIIGVAGHLFGCSSFASCSEIKEFVAQNEKATPDHSQSQKESGSEATPDPACAVTHNVSEEEAPGCLPLADLFTVIHNVSEEEAPGYLPLGNIIAYFCKRLSEKLNAVYKCHPQRVVAKNSNPEQNPSTDIAIILRTLSGAQPYISRVLYEYKHGVHHLLDMVDIKHLIELLLQCYYVLKYEKQSDIMGCLTDLVTWHYIGLNRNKDGKLKVTFYCKLSMKMPPNKTEMSTQFLFLLEYLKNT